MPGWVWKLAASGLLLAWIISHTDFSNVAQAFSQCRPGYLISAFLLQFVGLAIQTLRWKIALNALGHHASFGHLCRSYWIGTFFNMFLPSTVGGDVSRTLDTREHAGGGARSFAVVFMERFSGMFAMVVLAAAVLPYAAKMLPPGYYVYEMVLGLALLFALFTLLILFPSPALMRRLPSSIKKFHDALAAYRHRLSQLAVSFFWGILLQVNVVIYYYLLCRSLDLTIPLGYLFIVIPLVKVLLLFPISINGIGLRENAFAYFFEGKGVAVAPALALSWLDLGLTLIFALIGGALYVGRKRK